MFNTEPSPPAGFQLSAVPRCHARPALSRSTVNFATTQDADEREGYASGASLPLSGEETIRIDFHVHYVVRAPCLQA